MKRNTDMGTFIQTHTIYTWQTTWIALLSHVLRDLVLGVSTMSDIGNHQVKKKKNENQVFYLTVNLSWLIISGQKEIKMFKIVFGKHEDI